jgi:hypothetical protein
MLQSYSWLSFRSTGLAMNSIEFLYESFFWVTETNTIIDIAVWYDLNCEAYERIVMLSVLEHKSLFLS